MSKLVKLLVLAPIAFGALAMSGCGAGETPIPEGMDINNPNGKLGAPEHLKGGPPNGGGQLPGAPATTE
ncbi:MAG: hypothetical protein SNJ76_05300 [Fimbriimonadaceae bacterium]